MSTDTATDIDSALLEGHHVPTDRKFVITALLLAAVTAVEVAWSYLPWGEGTLVTVFEVGGLLLMMGWKFFMVAGVFMHLKFDKKLLTGVFYTGLFLAVGVYLIALTTFEFFSSSTPGFTP